MPLKIKNEGLKEKNFLLIGITSIIIGATVIAAYQKIHPVIIVLATATAMISIIIYTRQIQKKITKQIQKKFQKHIENLEGKLTKSEMMRLAEPHIMIIWQGKEDKPSKISGIIHEAPEIPTEPNTLLSFNSWIKKEHINIITEYLTKLRYDGKPFNIGIETQKGTILEADGRVAGSAALLKFRHITGERKDAAQNAIKYRNTIKQKQNLQNILDAAPMPIWVRDEKSGELKWVNQKYAEAVDEKNKENVLKKQTVLLPLPISYEKNTKQNKNAIINGINTPLQINETHIENGIAGFASDISKLENAQKELERHINAYTNSFDQIKTAIAIFSAKQKLQFYNNAYAQLWKLKQKWLDQNPKHGEILDRLREKKLLPEKADYLRWKKKQLKIYESLEKLEEWWYLPNNSVIHATTLIHPKGGVMCLYDDVTEKIILESRYNALIGVQKETLDHLHDGVALFGSDGELKLSNPSFIKFWKLKIQNEKKQHNEKKQQIHARNIITECKKLAPNDTQKWDKLRINLTNTQTTHQSRYQFKCHNGKIAEITTAPLPDGNILLTSIDVTDRIQIEQALRDKAAALEAADKIKTDFLSNISYVLRTPLTTIIGFADILKQKIVGPINEKQYEYIEDILKDAHKVADIIDSILDITSLQSGMVDLNLQSVSVNALMRETANSMKNEIEQKSLTLKVYMPDNIGALVVDPERMKKVIKNLVANAIGFSNQGEIISIECKKQNEYILISVNDTGKGMEKGIKEAAFDRFKSYPYAGGHRGVGLGLSIVKGFVELHDGDVFLDSDTNKGTIVTCKLPVAGPKRGHKKNGKEGNNVRAA